MADVEQIREGTILTRNQDILLGVCVVGILAVLVIPIPTWLLDILLSINISLAVVVMLSTIYLRDPVDFIVFPSLPLLVCTAHPLDYLLAIGMIDIGAGAPVSR